MILLFSLSLRPQFECACTTDRSDSIRWPAVTFVEREISGGGIDNKPYYVFVGKRSENGCFPKIVLATPAVAILDRVKGKEWASGKIIPPEFVFRFVAVEKHLEWGEGSRVRETNLEK